MLIASKHDWPDLYERQAKAKELREEGKTQQQIAEELGVSQRTVSDDLAENSVMTQKPAKEPRKVIQYKITQYTKPETAAKRIREVFGDELEAMRRVFCGRSPSAVLACTTSEYHQFQKILQGLICMTIRCLRQK